MDELEKWPYKQISINDNEQNEIKNHISNCCVAFIDILGFKNLVKNDIDRVILALRNIELFCNSVYKFPARANNTYSTAIYVEEDEKLLEHRPTVTMFSDSIVISQTIDDYFDLSEFVDFISKLQFELLSNGILIRGGISMGNLFHKDRYIFGDGLISSYLLESSKANYPRIIIDDLLIEYVNELNDKKFESYYKNYIFYDNEKLFLSPPKDDSIFTIYPYITTDMDGCYYIDYFKDNFLGRLESDKHYYEESQRILSDFLEGTMFKIRKYIVDGLMNSHPHDISKYEWLKNRYNKTLKWGLLSYNNAFENLEKEKDFYQKWNNMFI